MVYVSEGKVKVDLVGVKAVPKPDATNIAEAVCNVMDSEVSPDLKNMWPCFIYSILMPKNTNKTNLKKHV